eukprot:TRINITY_DN29133_c0_g1_i1.p1 TRINITY_DN29133_c0_g1~~TRINITY_DN29133_c0_g1_i1.p1  ORF type:complete len:441 (-),score=117.15 TRINITY_DN29133_c0_g1_i1:26-1297(-)
MIIGVDQTLLDIVAEVDDDPGIFERFKVQQNTQCLAEERHVPLIKDMLAKAESGEAKTTPGGVIANSLRGGSWWLKRQNGPRARMLMLGLVGLDTAAQRLRQELTAAGVEPALDDPPTQPDSSSEKQTSSGASFSESTGVCCCLLAHKERTMITELGISKTLHLSGKLAPTFLGWNQRMEKLKASASSAAQPWAVVTSGFYIQADAEGTAAMQSWCSRPQATSAGGKIFPVFAMTVGAEWCTGLPSVQAAARSADFVFANEAEVMQLASSICKATDQQAVAAGDYEGAMRVIARWKERGWMIGTRGSKSVGCILSAADPKALLSVPVPAAPKDEFVDDVGAGDAFMGGFLVAIWQSLAALCPAAAEGSADAEQAEGTSRKRKREDVPLVEQLTESDVEAAVKAGITVAGACIRCSGCQFSSAS